MRVSHTATDVCILKNYNSEVEIQEIWDLEMDFLGQNISLQSNLFCASEDSTSDALFTRYLLIAIEKFPKIFC